MKQILLAMAAAFSAAAHAIEDPESNNAPAATPGVPPDATKRRGRPPGSGAAAAPETPEKEALTGALNLPTTVPAGGKTYEQLQALIRPLVEEGRGEEVKKIIVKYSSTGLKDLAAKDHAAFEKDISALQY